MCHGWREYLAADKHHVEAAEGGLRDRADGMVYRVGALPEGFRSGHLIVRPESMQIGPGAQALPNRIEGVLFNDYALGSRVQYQVRGADGRHWLVEKLQDDAVDAALDRPVTIGWRPEDSIVVGP